MALASGRADSLAGVRKLNRQSRGLAQPVAANPFCGTYLVVLVLVKLRRQQNAKPSVTVAAPRRRESACSAAAELYILIVTTTPKDSLLPR